MNEGAHGLVNDVWNYLEEQVAGSKFARTTALSVGIAFPRSITRMLVGGFSGFF